MIRVVKYFYAHCKIPILLHYKDKLILRNKNVMTYAYIYIYIYICIYIPYFLLLLCKTHILVKLATIVEGDSKALFSIALHRGVEEGDTSFPGSLPFTLDTYFIVLSVKQGGINYHFWSFGMTRPGTELCFPGPLVNTQYCLLFLMNTYKDTCPHPHAYTYEVVVG